MFFFVRVKIGGEKDAKTVRRVCLEGKPPGIIEQESKLDEIYMKLRDISSFSSPPRAEYIVSVIIQFNLVCIFFSQSLCGYEMV